MSGVKILMVKPDETGLRLDRWFQRHYPQLPHGRLEKLLRKGQVRVDGARARAGDRLEEGQAIRVPPISESDSASGGAPVKRAGHSMEQKKFVRSLVLYEDDDVIVLNKPPGLAVQGGTRIRQHLDALLESLHGEGDVRPRLVHRLDKDTSGVLVLGRTVFAAARLTRTFRDRTARKLYWALVAGVPKTQSGVIDRPLLKTGRTGSALERMHPVPGQQNEDGQKAVTRYAVIEQAGQKLSWLALMPLTGRTHQLRAHCVVLGVPIVGDGKYGGPMAHPGGELSRKLHLHARALDIPHPRGGRMLITASLPDHMKASWAFLDFDETTVGDPFSPFPD